MTPAVLLMCLHPTTGGWRWAIHLDSTIEQAKGVPGRRCINSGIRPTLEEADAEGQTVLYSLMAFCDMKKIPRTQSGVTSDEDWTPSAGS